jgi:hypothetical protein
MVWVKSTPWTMISGRARAGAFRAVLPRVPDEVTAAGPPPNSEYAMFHPWNAKDDLVDIVTFIII